MRRALLLVASAIAFLLVGEAGRAGAQEPTPTEPCTEAESTVVFVGRTTAIVDDVVTFRVLEVRTDDEELVGDDVEVVYASEYNARELVVDGTYLVFATGSPELRSVVPTAEIDVCGQSTLHADGARIDTGTLTGVKDRFPRLAQSATVVVVVALVALVILGRFFDRRSRYQ